MPEVGSGTTAPDEARLIFRAKQNSQAVFRIDQLILQCHYPGNWKILMKRFIPLCFWLLSISAAFSALQTPIDFNFSFNGSNAVQVVWNAYPGKSYVLQTATNLSGSRSNSSTLVATSNSLAFSFSTNKQPPMN
jgi:hypothetical protein